MFADAAKVREAGNLPPTVLDEKITPHLKLASTELRRLLTSEKYTEISGWASEQDGSERKQAYTDCQNAEANLAMSYAVTVLNIETDGTGIVRETGFDQSRRMVLSQNESKALSDYFRGIAMSLIALYIPADPVIEPEQPDTVKSGTFMMGAI